jgi:hypothetical protein
MSPLSTTTDFPAQPAPIPLLPASALTDNPPRPSTLLHTPTARPAPKPPPPPPPRPPPPPPAAFIDTATTEIFSISTSLSVLAALTI